MWTVAQLCPEMTPISGHVYRFEGARGPVWRAKYARLGGLARLALVNGEAGFIVVRDGILLTVAGLTIVGDRIKDINVLADPKRLRALDAASTRGLAEAGIGRRSGEAGCL